MEINGIKVKITEDMIGQDCIVLSEKKWYQNFNYGEFNLFCYKSKIDHISLEQNNLYWACCNLVAENMQEDKNFNTREKVSDQCKVHNRHAKGFFSWINSKGKQCVQLILRSISFKDFNNRDSRNEYFDKSFEYMSELLECDKEALVEEAKKRMSLRKTCILCGREATQEHHMFSNSKTNKEIYGSKIINANFNKIPACEHCNSSHANPEIHKYIIHEKEFDNLILEQNNKELIFSIKDDCKRIELLTRYEFEKRG